MRCHERMRYYQPFPAAIPLWKAGCPRVTHPSATKLKRSVRKHLWIVPFDLHVLGTPPAFILSQDQTLMLKFYVSSETFKILIRKKFSWSKWTWLSIFILLLNWVVRILWSLKSFLQFNVLWISSNSPFFWHGPLSKTAGHEPRKLFICDLKYKGIYSGLHFCLVLI